MADSTRFYEDEFNLAENSLHASPSNSPRLRNVPVHRGVEIKSDGFSKMGQEGATSRPELCPHHSTSEDNAVNCSVHFTSIGAGNCDSVDLGHGFRARVGHTCSRRRQGHWTPNGDGHAAYIFTTIAPFGIPRFTVASHVLQKFPNPFNQETCVLYKLPVPHL